MKNPQDYAGFGGKIEAALGTAKDLGFSTQSANAMMLTITSNIEVGGSLDFYLLVHSTQNGEDYYVFYQCAENWEDIMRRSVKAKTKRYIKVFNTCVSVIFCAFMTFWILFPYAKYPFWINIFVFVCVIVGLITGTIFDVHIDWKKDPKWSTVILCLILFPVILGFILNSFGKLNW